MFLYLLMRPVIVYAESEVIFYPFYSFSDLVGKNDILGASDYYVLNLYEVIQSSPPLVVFFIVSSVIFFSLYLLFRIFLRRRKSKYIALSSPLIHRFEQESHLDFTGWLLFLTFKGGKRAFIFLRQYFRVFLYHPSKFRVFRIVFIFYLLFLLTFYSSFLYLMYSRVPFVLAATLQDSAQADFDAGTYNNTQYNTTSGWVELTGTGKSNGLGEYTSAVKSPGGESSWDSISWNPNYPVGKELPNNKGKETAYSSGNADMTGNVLLMHMNDSSGSTSFTDSSGEGNNGTCSGSNCPIAGVSGIYNTAVQFDGTDDYINCSTNNIPASPPLTLEAWVKFLSNSNSTGYMYLIRTSNYANGDILAIARRNSDRAIYYVEGASVRAGPAVPDNQWTHIVFVFNTTAPYVKAYINGQEVSITQPSAVVNPGSVACRLGGYTDSVLHTLNGILDEVAVYNRVLSSSEVLDRYKRGIGRLKFQVRSCNDSACSGESFIGPDGTGASYYQWGNINSLSLPSFNLTNVANNQYFQYKVFFETIDSSYSPELKSVTINYTSLNQAPNTPTNQTPAGASTGVFLNPELSASTFSDPENDSHSATEWQVDDDSDFSSPVWTRTSSSGEITTIVNPTNGTFSNELSGKTGLVHKSVYYWRVRYKDSAGNWSGWSTGISFTTNTLNRPTNQTPSTGATVVTLTPLLTASAFSDEESGHTHIASQWQVDNNADFSSPDYDSGETISALTSLTVPSGKLTNFSTYYWRVRYKDNSGFWSDWSNPTSFTISISEISIQVKPLFTNVRVDQGDDIRINAQIVNFSDGSTINDAAAYITIFSPTGSKLIDNQQMNYLTGSKGIYYYDYTIPSTKGTYIYQITTTKGNKTGEGAGNFTAVDIGSKISNIQATLQDHESSQSTARSKISDIQNKVIVIQQDTNTIKSDLSTVKSDVALIKKTSFSTEGQVLDDNPSTSVFKTNLTQSRNDFYKNMLITFTSGDNQGQSRRIKTYNGTTKTITVIPDLSFKPKNGDTFIILTRTVRVEELAESIGDIWNRVDKLSKNLPDDYSGIYNQLVAISTSLDDIASLRGSGFKNLLSITPEIKNDIKLLRNKLLDLQAAIEIVRVALAGGGNGTLYSTWYTFDSIVLNVLIANPTQKKQRIPVRAYLPKEVQQEHIISTGGLNIEYDESAQRLWLCMVSLSLKQERALLVELR